MVLEGLKVIEMVLEVKIEEANLMINKVLKKSLVWVLKVVQKL